MTVADWVRLYTEKASNNPLFWEGFPEAFAGQDETYDKILFMNNKILSDLYHINLRKVVIHV